MNDTLEKANGNLKSLMGDEMKIKDLYKKGKQDLLHDIIFMADSRDAFMIIDVDELKLKNYNKLVIINLLYRC